VRRTKGDERRAEAVGEVQYRATPAMSQPSYEQFEEAARGRDRGSTDDVADRTHQRESRRGYDEAEAMARRFELPTPTWGPASTAQRRCGRNRPAIATGRTTVLRFELSVTR